MVFAKNPPMIKSKRDFLVVYGERIRLKNSFWDKKCVYLLVSFHFPFLVMLALMGNESLHLCETANALQTGALMCIPPLLPLHRPLLFGINARNEWVMYIGLVNVIMMILLFLDSLATPLFVSSFMRQDRDTVTRQFVFCVLRIYYELMFCPPNDTCTVRMASLC